MTTESGVSYGRRLRVLAEQRRDRSAVVVAFHDGTETHLNWRELDRRSNQTANLLIAGGVPQDGLVVVALPNRAEHLFATCGAWKAGASVLALRHDLPEWERTRLLEVARPAAVVADWEEADLRTVDVTGSADGDDRPPADHVPSCARMIATSGSTGRPKIIFTPAPGMYSDLPGAIAPAALREGRVQDSVHLATSPLYHTNGWGACYLSLLAGERVVLMERFDAARAVDLIEKHRVTHTIMVPTMLQRIARLPGVAERDFASLERVLYGGASLPEWAARAWIDLVGPDRFWISYGSSEGLGLCLTTGHQWLERPGTVGRPVDCEITILDSDRQPVPAGEVGEIFLRPLDTTGRTFCYIGCETPGPTPDGYWTIGDMGWVDPDGYLYIADRRQDMIVTGGANVFPAEVEAALSEHPGVSDSVVIGLPDPDWGHRVHAIVQPTDPVLPPPTEELRAHCRDRLAAYKVPKTYEFVAALGRSAAGKINRSALAAERAQPAAAAPAEA